MKALFDQVSLSCSRITTRKYSTSFSMGILFLQKPLRDPIYAIYGFVRLADEIVDSLHDYNREKLLNQFKADTFSALEDRVSVNPILNSFQQVVHRYHINRKWINLFFESMEMDLHEMVYTEKVYDRYILGSAEAVGLMCLHVFTGGDEELFQILEPYAMKLGAAFQKVNFLRDMKADREFLGRTYFPGIEFSRFTQEQKKLIEQDIEKDFAIALTGIRMLPAGARSGVYLAYRYYRLLFNKLKRTTPQHLLRKRIRIPNFHKIMLLLQLNLRLKMNML
jgi:15-cis-phytoene synthase